VDAPPPPPARRRDAREIPYASCCGLEVHKDSITACLRRLESTGQVPQLLRTFGTTPGIDQRMAEARIAELGVDMTVFPSDRHCASWVGLCPGNHESAGKRKSGKPRKGNQGLRAALVEAAWAASHTKGCLGAQYHRLARRRGKKKAAGAVAHSLLVIAYHILKEGPTYRELGHDYFDKRDTARLQRRLITRLELLGLRVPVEPLPQAA